MRLRRAATSPQSKLSPVPPRRPAPDGEAGLASNRWKSTWKRSLARTSPGVDTCTALITRAPVRRASSAHIEGPSSPCSCSSVRPSWSAVETTKSGAALTNTPHSSTRRRSRAQITAACSIEQRRGLGS